MLSHIEEIARIQDGSDLVEYFRKFEPDSYDAQNEIIGKKGLVRITNTFCRRFCEATNDELRQ